MAIINYDTEKLDSAINDFYNSTGVNIRFLKADFTSTSEKKPFRQGAYCSRIQQTTDGQSRCYECDKFILEKCRISKKTEVHICHAGLVDVAVPVVYHGNVVAYIILGQMKKDKDFEAVKKYVSDLPLDFDLLKDDYNKMPLYNEEKVMSIANIATMLSKYILLESMLKPETDTAFEKALEYIDKNIESHITLNDISRESHISKTTVYKYFHRYFGCTPSDYINKKRVEKSTEYLKTTDMSIELISQKVGFLSSSYYTRIFKKYMGITPRNFRK